MVSRRDPRTKTDRISPVCPSLGPLGSKKSTTSSVQGQENFRNLGPTPTMTKIQNQDRRSDQCGPPNIIIFECDPVKSYSTKYVLSLLHLLIRPPVEPIRHLPSVLLILQYIDQNPNLFKNDKVKIIKYSRFLFFVLVSCMATFGNNVE